MKKNILAVFVGIFFSLVLFAFLESLFRFNESFQLVPPRVQTPHVHFDQQSSQALYEELKDQPVFKWQPRLSREQASAIDQEDLELIYDRHLPCCVGRMAPVKSLSTQYSLVHKKTKKIVSMANYSFDEFGRRMTPKSADPKYNILFFGGSFAFGQAVDDEQSGPFLLGKMRPEAQVYNFGLPGGSPNEFLYELEMDPSPRLQGLPQRRSIILYAFIESHFDRLFCTSQCVREDHSWVINKPYYKREQGEIRFQGFFDTDRPYQNMIYGLLNDSALFRFFDIVWPLYYSKKHDDFFSDLLLKAEQKSKVLLEDSEFYLVLFPGASHHLGRKLKAASQKKGIKVLDYSGLDMNIVTNHRFQIPIEMHPSPVTQFVFSYLLNRDLPKNK